MYGSKFKIDVPLVANLLKQQFPTLTNLPITQIKHFGTDNAIFRIGNKYAIRLPKTDSSTKQILKEQMWLPKLAQYIPFIIPIPVNIGQPAKIFPYPWYIYNWIEGVNAYDKKPSDLSQTAKDLATFIRALWRIDIHNAPTSRRGLPLASQDEAVHNSIAALKNMVATDTITTIWQECLNTSNWNKPPVWLHGDLLPSNLIIQDGKLNTVIDFGLMGVGDPACDLIPAWCLFDTNSRKIFKDALDIDDNTWMRGKGWALAIALVIIPYYLNTNPVLVSVAKHIINAITSDR